MTKKRAFAPKSPNASTIGTHPWAILRLAQYIAAQQQRGPVSWL